jgi:L-2-hydroxyglutarate oxidase
MKAELAVTGIPQMVAFCQEHGIPDELCGKLVVAATPTEFSAQLHVRTGTAERQAGLRKLGVSAKREIEAHVRGVAAIRVPEEGIADYPTISKTLTRCLAVAGAKVITQAWVTQLRRKSAQ